MSDTQPYSQTPTITRRTPRFQQPYSTCVSTGYILSQNRLIFIVL